jgi:transposase
MCLPSRHGNHDQHLRRALLRVRIIAQDCPRSIWRSSDGGHQGVTVFPGPSVQALDIEIAALEEKIESLLAATAPDLLGPFGVGSETASTLLVTAGDNPERLQSEAAWAHLCGVSPIPGDSGRSAGHLRDHQGGDRRAKSALWLRIAHDPETTLYMGRRVNEGWTKQDVIRILNATSP